MTLCLNLITTGIFGIVMMIFGIIFGWLLSKEWYSIKEKKLFGNENGKLI